MPVIRTVCVCVGDETVASHQAATPHPPRSSAAHSGSSSVGQVLHIVPAGQRLSDVRADAALAIQIVIRTEWAQLDELRDLRHRTNYPSDLIEPTDVELDQFSALTGTVVARARSKIAPIPPPAGRRVR